MTEHEIACREIEVGDKIRPSTQPNSNDLDNLAEVTTVDVRGVMVRIETNIGTTEILPINRCINVWR
jgi:hypothetical protein